MYVGNITANTTYAVSNIDPGQSVQVVMTSTGAFTPTFTNVTFAGGIIPGTLSNGQTVTFIFVNTGTNIIGSIQIPYGSGKFTPIFLASTMGDFSVAYTQQIGTYTVIGNRCFVDVYVSGTVTFTTATGVVLVGGFPFPNIANININYPVEYYQNLAGVAQEGISARYYELLSNVYSFWNNDGQSGFANIGASGKTWTISMSFNYQIS
jgi:hypothetical protein